MPGIHWDAISSATSCSPARCAEKTKTPLTATTTAAATVYQTSPRCFKGVSTFDTQSSSLGGRSCYHSIFTAENTKAQRS